MDGDQVLSVSAAAACPACHAELWLERTAAGVRVTRSTPRHARWSALDLAWSPAGALAVSSIHPHRLGLVRLEDGAPRLVRSLEGRIRGFSADGGLGLLSQRVPLRPGSAYAREEWFVGRRELGSLSAKLPLDLGDRFDNPLRPGTSRGSYASGQAVFHRDPRYVALFADRPRAPEEGTSAGGNTVSLVAWDHERGRVERVEDAAFHDTVGWLEPGGDRLLCERRVGDARLELSLHRYDCQPRLRCRTLAARQEPGNLLLSRVVWEPEGTLLLLYLRNERGLAFHEHAPFEALRLHGETLAPLTRAPLDPHACPAGVQALALGALGPRMLLATDALYAFDRETFRPEAVLPVSLGGAEGVCLDPWQSRVAIAGPDDVHVASLVDGTRVSLRDRLG